MGQTINPEILVYIRENIAFRQDIIAHFPQLSSYVDSYIADNKCSCKNTILKYMWDSRDSKEFYILQSSWQDIMFIVGDDPTSLLNINKREMFGEVVIIPSTKEAYRNLIRRAREEQWIFHGFTVTESRRKWKVYFY